MYQQYKETGSGCIAAKTEELIRRIKVLVSKKKIAVFKPLEIAQ